MARIDALIPDPRILDLQQKVEQLETVTANAIQLAAGDVQAIGAQVLAAGDRADAAATSVQQIGEQVQEGFEDAITELGETTSQKIGELDAVKDATEAERIATAEAREQAQGVVAAGAEIVALAPVVAADADRAEAAAEALANVPIGTLETTEELAEVVLDSRRRVGRSLSKDGRRHRFSGFEFRWLDANTLRIMRDDGTSPVDLLRGGGVRIGGSTLLPSSSGDVVRAQTDSRMRAIEVLRRTSYTVHGLTISYDGEASIMSGPDGQKIITAKRGEPVIFHGAASGGGGGAVPPTYAWPDARPAAASTIKAKDSYVRGREVLPVLPDMARIAGWGSSTMNIASPILAAMAAGYGAAYFNGGKGGELAQHIAARMGAIPMLARVAGGIIPASGSVDVTSSNVPPNVSMQSFAGTLAGVAGTMAANGNTGFTFTRAATGAATAVADDTPFFPTAGPLQRAAVTILNIGKNNITQNGTNYTVEQITAYCDTMYDWLAPLVKRALVLGHFVNNDEPAGGAKRAKILAVNAAWAQRYGVQFVDLQGWVAEGKAMYGQTIWQVAGITPTSTDIAQQAAGNKPDSLSAELPGGGIDPDHLNTAANNAVRWLLEQKIAELGWYGA